MRAPCELIPVRGDSKLRPDSKGSLRRCVVGLALAAMLLALSIVPSASDAAEAGNDDPKLTKIVQAWRARQQRIKTVQISCDATWLRAKWPYDTTSFKEQGVYDPHLFPEKDMVSTTSVTLLLGEGGRTRMDSLGGDGGPKCIRNSSFDGNKAILFTNHHDRFPFPGGQIIKPENLLDPRSTDYSWFYIHFRMFDPIVGAFYEGWALETLRVLDQPGEYEGSPVTIVELPHKVANNSRRWWIDPKRDYTIVRQQHISDGSLLIQTDGQFSRTEGEWVPTGWKSSVLFPDGSIRSSAAFKVTTSAINQPLKPDAFKIEFVPGTWVSDSRIEGRQSYIIDKEGRRRDILDHEFGATYEELLNSRSGEAKPKPKPQEPGAPQAKRPFPLLPLTGVAGVLLAAICVAALIFRRPQIS